ncbi:MAG: hypothetical protein L0Y36_03140 [Planctomycetales bacterium]|nr:hypothetical protein [Planctomycetales bacterium]
MKCNSFTWMVIAVFGALTPLPLWAEEPADLTEPMKKSLVYLEISNSRYEQYQPWKQTAISKEDGYACAVGPYEVLTTAENVLNATLVQARCYGQNEYIPAKVSVVDYEYNLCLLELDKSAMEGPLTPLQFVEKFPKGKSLDSYWLSGGGQLTKARCTLDRAEMQRSSVSYVSNLIFFATNVSRGFGDGEVCCFEKETIGMACWGTDSDSGIIPSETINRFLTYCKKEGYSGFGTAGFEVHELLDPTMRQYLKLPGEIKHGVYVGTVYSLGTGSKELKQGDVILTIDGQTLNPYGRYEHPQYDRISFSNLILQKPDGAVIPFEIFRDGTKRTVDVVARNIKSKEMLIPYYLYSQQPEYIVVGGYILQKLSRDFLGMWGSDWAGEVPPHLYHYYQDFSFKPTSERKDIVVLSYVLPAEINLGYQELSMLVVDSINGKKIREMKDIPATLESNDSEFIEITFEMNSPAIIIPKDKLAVANMQIAQMYGISKTMNIRQ